MGARRRRRRMLGRARGGCAAGGLERRRRAPHALEEALHVCSLRPASAAGRTGGPARAWELRCKRTRSALSSWGPTRPARMAAQPGRCMQCGVGQCTQRCSVLVMAKTGGQRDAWRVPSAACAAAKRWRAIAAGGPSRLLGVGSGEVRGAPARQATRRSWWPPPRRSARAQPAARPMPAPCSSLCAPPRPTPVTLTAAART